MPAPSAEEVEAMKLPAERADELLVDFVVDGVEYRQLRLTGKQLDGADDEPALFLDVCLKVAERAVRELTPRAVIDKARLRSVSLDGEIVTNALTTVARTLLMRSGLRVVLGFYGSGEVEAALVALQRKYHLHGVRVREGHTLCFTRMSESSAPLGLEEVRTLATLVREHAPLAVKNLYLDDNLLGPEAIALLAPLLASSGLLPRLETLVLTSNAMGEQGMATLCAALAARAELEPPPPPLALLDIASNQIGDGGVAALATEVGAGRCAVERVDVSANGAAEATERELAQAIKLAKSKRRAPTASAS